METTASALPEIPLTATTGFEPKAHVSSPVLHRQGAHLGVAGVHYCVWAPSARKVAAEVRIRGAGLRVVRTVELRRQGDGFFAGHDPEGRAGDHYWLRLNDGECLPDPVSRFQPEGIEGPSEVVDPRVFSWTDGTWKRPDLRELVIYEIHIGTFTPEGTFRAAIKRLRHVRDLGATAIEIMPIAEFPGKRNWGYDGAMLYAPEHVHGTPDDFRALVDAAHAEGLTVILDVVYNHFGPDGNRLRQFAPHFFDADRLTPWGDSVHFDGPSAPQVRAFFRQNLAYWMEEFHIDGFRLDATHAIYDASEPHILRELRDEAHLRGGFVIAEDERREETLLLSEGFHLDGAWADDFHHSVEVALIGERSVYKGEFAGSAAELAEALQRGWTGRPPTRQAASLQPQQFVFCISNHDQVGNRPWGDRLHQICDPSAYRAASALLCLSPQTPLLFMGQEWGATTPFTYFTDHNETLGRDIEEGRRKDLAQFVPHAREVQERGIPSPQASGTFEMCRLNWDELSGEPHSSLRELYQNALAWRRKTPFGKAPCFAALKAHALPGEVVAMRAVSDEKGDWLLLCRLTKDGGPSFVHLDDEKITMPPSGQRWRVVWSSNEHSRGGTHESKREPVESVALIEPELLLLQAEQS